MSQKAVETRDLTRIFKGPSGRIISALQEVNISIDRGEIFGLLGPNGAGKTTLIKILTTLLLPTSGAAYVLGRDVVRETTAIRKAINLVSGGETPGYGILSVRENMWFFSQLHGLPRSVAKPRIEYLLDELGLSEHGNSRMNKLSTGYKQRLNLARGFINNPEVLFLDEPTLGLDVLSARNIRRFVKKWVAEDKGRTVLLTTHYMGEADELCDRLALISGGKILASGSPSELKARISGEITIRVDVGSGSWDTEQLKVLDGVIGISEKANIESGVTSLKIILKEESAISSIISNLNAQGAKIFSVGRTEQTLEDVYVTLVGRGIDQNAAHG